MVTLIVDVQAASSLVWERICFCCQDEWKREEERRDVLLAGVGHRPRPTLTVDGRSFPCTFLR